MWKPRWAGLPVGASADLVVHDVVVHRQHAVFGADQWYGLQWEVPQALAFGRPDLQAAGGGRVVAPAERACGRQQLVLAEQARGAAADEFLRIVEGQRVDVVESGVGLPGVHEADRLVDLAAPLLGAPGAHAPGVAEVPVEVRADLVALQPRRAHLPDRGLDVVVVEVADRRGAERFAGRGVEHPLAARQRVDAGQEERHGRLRLLGDLPEVREQFVVVLTGAVPGEDHELRRTLSGREPLGHRLQRLRPGRRGRAVADQPRGARLRPARPALCRLRLQRRGRVPCRDLLRPVLSEAPGGLLGPDHAGGHRCGAAHQHVPTRYDSHDLNPRRAHRDTPGGAPRHLEDRIVVSTNVHGRTRTSLIAHCN